MKGLGEGSVSVILAAFVYYRKHNTFPHNEHTAVVDYFAIYELGLH